MLAGDFHRGREIAIRAIAINPNLSYAWNARGVMGLVLGEPDIALDAFARAMKLNPLDNRAVPLALFGSGAACCFLKQYDDGLGFIGRLLAIRPSDIRGLFVLTAIMLHAGRETEAQAAVNRIKQEYPSLRSHQLRQAYAVLQPDFMRMVECTIAYIGLPE
jgi:tetratricopeptide (TPR) repeat protein